MSATLVETYSFQCPHQHKPNLSLSLFPSSVDVPHDQKSTTQLVHLASQHHGSEYNRLKFGPNGCPVLYIPMSFHMPEYVKELQARQIACTEQRAWWPCPQRERTTASNNVSKHALSLGPGGSSGEDMRRLQGELSAAMNTPMESSFQLAVNIGTHLPLKTSETHPLNISPMVVPKLLPLISSSLTPLPRPSPVMFDIPTMYQLDRVASRHPPSISPPHQSPFHDSSDLARISIAKTLRAPSRHLFSQSNISTAIQAAIGSGFRAASTITVSTSLLETSRDQHLSSIRSTSSMSVVQPLANTPCRNDGWLSQNTLEPGGTANIPNSTPSFSLNLSILSLPQSLAFTNDSPTTPTSFSISDRSVSPDARASACESQTSFEHNSISISTTTDEKITEFFSHSFSSSLSSSSLGNVFLSSCPGKKVRLSGPIKGRCSVYRDLHMDLKRIRSLHVACVICCLDNDELQYLGVPWPEYSRAAHEIGVDVLRIPIPEGLPPLSLSSLDAHLSHVIHTYTLKGLPILVHCRGGVGRAGLIACCWMLKLGLCGWIETDLPRGSSQEIGNTNANPNHAVRRDTMQLVERAIGVVRSRRSVKAVETYEQVKFLAEFVEYLRETSTGAALQQ